MYATLRHQTHGTAPVCVLQVKNPKIASKNGDSCNSVLEKNAAIPAELSSSAMTVLQTYFQVNSYRFWIYRSMSAHCTVK